MKSLAFGIFLNIYRKLRRLYVENGCYLLATTVLHFVQRNSRKQKNTKVTRIYKKKKT